MDIVSLALSTDSGKSAIGLAGDAPVPGAAVDPPIPAPAGEGLWTLLIELAKVQVNVGLAGVVPVVAPAAGAPVPTPAAVPETVADAEGKVHEFQFLFSENKTLPCATKVLQMLLLMLAFQAGLWLLCLCG